MFKTLFHEKVQTGMVQIGINLMVTTSHQLTITMTSLMIALYQDCAAEKKFGA